MKRCIHYCVAFGATMLCLGMTAAQTSVDYARPTPHSAALQQTWKLALLYRVKGRQRQYVGVAQRPKGTIPNRLTGAPRNRPSASNPHFEIWMIGSGADFGIWYEPTSKTIGQLPFAADRGVPDTLNVAQMLKSVRKTVARLPSITTLASAGLGPSQRSLRRLAEASEIVATGQVVAPLRHGHNPMNSSSKLQHTVFVFAVEEYLRRSTRHRTPYVKVYCPGGPLPWKDAETGFEGVGLEFTSDPLLAVGERYILFLARPGYPDGMALYQRLGFIPSEARGIAGKAAELDEYIVFDPPRGKILLTASGTRPYRHANEAHWPLWTFEEGPQVLGLSEAEAVARIRAVLKE